MTRTQTETDTLSIYHIELSNETDALPIYHIGSSKYCIIWPYRNCKSLLSSYCGNKLQILQIQNNQIQMYTDRIGRLKFIQLPWSTVIPFSQLHLKHSTAEKRKAELSISYENPC